MEDLKRFVGYTLTGAFVTLVIIDMVDDLWLGGRWAGPPAELYGIVSLLVGGLFATRWFTRSGNGR